MARVSRRKLLVGGALLTAGGIVALVRTTGYDEPWERVVVKHLARRVCAPDAPDAVTPDAVDVAGFVDAYSASMPAKQRRDLSRFLRFVEQLAPLAVGYASRFTRLAPADQDRVLESLEANSNDLLRGGFDAVKSLLFMGYYRDPRTWAIVGYEGPRI